MNTSWKLAVNPPPEQEAIRAKCFHPSGTFVEFPIEDVETSIPERFEKIVRLYPDCLAIKDKDRSLTYDQLNRAANRIAHAIIERRGQGSEPIALLFEHGMDVIAALLGVLKAGKFYVALDPSFPQERLKYMLQDSEAPIVLVNHRSFELGEQITKSSFPLLNVEEIDESLSSENLCLAISPVDLVNIRYTSGSTGVPKGVTRNHRSSSQVPGLMRVSPDDRFSLIHSVSFGSSAMDLYLSLLNGASTFLFDVKRESVQRLLHWLSEEQITICHFPPALFRQVAEVLSDRRQLSNLRLVRLSGAAISRLEFELYREKFPAETLLEIGMGSTEAGRICSATLDQTFSFPDKGAPVGYPVKGIEIRLLGEDGREVSVGEIGEIAVSGSSLAFGYWKEPELTGAKFLPDPGDANRCIYLTGDLGQMLSDGFLIHRGRKDLTVKIRGYRVNISEVEAALLEHPGVKEAGVAAWDRDSGEKYLVGYVVPREGPSVDVSELNKFLRSKLPGYMIPSTVMFLESLPVTNGKVDRNTLPKPNNTRPDLKASYVPPRTDIEKRLSRIWSEVLSLDRVGADDNFFDLGGHSLAVSRLVSRVLDSFQVEVPLKSLFESPTLAGFAQRVEGVLHQAQNRTFLPLISVPRDRRLAVSFSQQALWFHDQLEPGSCAYNIIYGYQFSGELDVQALERSFNRIIDRHEVLRTVFHAIDGQPVPIILPAMRIELQVMDARLTAPEQTRESEVGCIAGQLARQPFDLTRGPLLRAALLRLASDECVLLLVVHHIVVDAWSTGIFCRELSQIYNSLKNGKPSPLPPLSIQYSDFAVWQRGRLQDVTLENHISYWRKQLDGLSTLRLPITRLKLESDSSFSAREEFQFSEELLATLRKLNERTGTTLFMLLLTAYKVALHRYTGQTDIAVGTPTAGRNHPQVEELIGFFLNMLVLRTDLCGNPTFRELLERIRKVCVDALTHQDLPFETIVEELRPRRDLSQNPLIQVTFALQNTPKCPLNLMGVTARDLDISAGIARPLNLHLFMVEELSGVRGYVSYNTSLFQADFIRRFISHLQNILMGIVANPDQRIFDLPMLTEPEKHRLLVEWNDTGRDYPKDKCIHQLFEEQVERTPEAIAVVLEDQELTYGELNRRANQLARYLRKLGVGSEVLVGTCMERSLEMIVGLLGILKAGGAYVPLDPSYPKERLGFILKEIQVGIILTNAASLTRLPSTDNARLICLDRDWQEVARESQDNLSNENTAASLAYVLYTSGSTGDPKGVQVPHRGVVRLLFGVDHVQFDKTQAFLHMAPVSFDATTFELWGALLHGANCVLFPGEVPSPRELGRVLKKHRVGTLWLTAALFNTVIDQEPQALSGVKQLLIGGEALSVPHVRKAFSLLPGTEIINGYGPTESTTFTCCYRIPCQLDDNPSSIPIGTPIGNTQVYILDAHLNPVPIGGVGEIHIGGDGLARGYLNRPELTAEKFIANFFSHEPGARLYKTGDLARYLPEGNIEFLGRIDNQVKLRGYRIELGEIEAVLGQHPMVQSSVVVVREDTPGDKRLVGYVVARSDESFDIQEVRKYLKQKLPEYMIPSQFVLLDALPLTPNGKVGRKALPAPDQDRPELGNVYQAPRTPMEETLATIWSELLKVDKVGIHDNFFELGGHSLMATQVISRVRSCFSVEVPLRTLFESPTIEQMAAAIMEQQEARPGQQEYVSFELESLPDEGAERVVAEETGSTSAGEPHE